MQKNRYVEGEMFLSLAEAEIHKAWENSVSSRREEKKYNGIFSGRLLSKVIVIGLILLLFISGYSYYSTIKRRPSLRLTLPRVEERYTYNLHKGENILENVELTLEE